MKTINNQPLPAQNFYLPSNIPRVKSSKTTIQSQIKPVDNNDETVQYFGYSEYIFINSTYSRITSHKTVINFQLSSDHLQKLVSINHPNIISIHKIVKSNPKQSKPNSYPLSYSFFYESVLYSLSYLMAHPQQNLRLFNLMMSFDFKNILMSVLRHLQQNNIFHGFRVADLGITKQGNIKVFVSPSCVLQPKNHTVIQRSIQNILQWWNNSKNNFRQIPMSRQNKTLAPPKLSNKLDLSLDDASVDQNQLEKELGCLLEDEPSPKKTAINDMKSSTQSLSRVGSIQLEKMKKIDEQVKNFRAKLNQKQEHSRKTEDNKKKAVQNLLGYHKNTAEQQYHEPIQQNINCINIYNHNNPPPHMMNRFASMPNYYPYTCPQMDQHQQYQYDDQYSQDTYDIEFETQFEPVETQREKDPNNFRYTIFTPSQRDMSEHPKRKPKNPVNCQQDYSNNNLNQVYKNKNYTESAGPLQFKSFVNKYMKPKLQQLQDKPQPSITNNAQSLRSYSINPQQLKSQSLMHRNHSQNEFQPMTTLKKRYKTEIENKVQKALEKTKNAIALLNKVKQSKISKQN